MHRTHLSAGALVKADVPLEGLGELAAILAAGVLGLKTRLESAVASGLSATTESGTSSLENAAEELSESRRNCPARPRRLVLVSLPCEGLRCFQTRRAMETTST